MRLKHITRLRIKLDPVEVRNCNFTPKSNFNKYITFVSGSLLAISESLPFFDNIKSNGLLHMLSGIHKEYKDEFGK